MASLQRARGPILIVEDEALIRMSAVDFIEDAGFTTLEAASADDALGILKKGVPITGLFSDIDMPGGLDGIALAERVRQDWPDVNIVLASGRVRVEESDLPPGVKFFPKPYNADDIVDALRKI